ncbi:MAG: PQQ-dependent sugar dehydrogenase, partial [Duganella sp.]
MRTNTTLATRASSLLILLGLAGCGSSSNDERPQPPAQPTPPTQPAQPGAVAVVATGLRAPWSVAFYNGTALVSERDTARIVAVGSNGALTEVAVIAGVDGNAEGGLLGIAVHNGFLYTYFTAGAENRIVRYPLQGSGVNLRLGAVQRILGGIPAASTHNGGRIAFGPDGMLYATTGDAGVPARAQDQASLAGKILRMTPDGAIPTDNPIPGTYIYSMGHRNPQGLAWASNGALYASEFGQNTWDELNLIRPGGNYGWPVVEGRAGNSRYTDPLQQWSTSTASPSGMTIADGNIYIANLRGERLRQIALTNTAVATERYGGEYGRLRDVVTTPNGQLWMVTNNTDGRGQARTGDDR